MYIGSEIYLFQPSSYWNWFGDISAKQREKYQNFYIRWDFENMMRQRWSLLINYNGKTAIQAGVTARNTSHIGNTLQRYRLGKGFQVKFLSFSWSRDFSPTWYPSFISQGSVLYRWSIPSAPQCNHTAQPSIMSSRPSFLVTWRYKKGKNLIGSGTRSSKSFRFGTVAGIRPTRHFDRWNSILRYRVTRFRTSKATRTNKSLLARHPIIEGVNRFNAREITPISSLWPMGFNFEASGDQLSPQKCNKKAKIL